MSDMDGYLDTECRDCGLVPCDCPSDLDAPEMCAHRVRLHDYCAECAVAGEMALADAFVRMLAKVQQTQDEETGAALAARFEVTR